MIIHNTYSVAGALQRVCSISYNPFNFPVKSYYYYPTIKRKLSIQKLSDLPKSMQLGKHSTGRETPAVLLQSHWTVGAPESEEGIEPQERGLKAGGKEVSVVLLSATQLKVTSVRMNIKSFTNVRQKEK